MDGSNARYLIIGNGRVATHISHYFSLQGLHYDHWFRPLSQANLTEKLRSATHVLILINDGSIESFATQHLENCKASLIHFSGSVFSANVFGAHPLCCFAKNLFTQDEYSAIPFVLDEHAPPLTTLLPGLPNRFFYLNPALKKKYHAICVLAGNFSCLLWQKLFSTFQEEFNLPAEIAFPYLLQNTKHLMDLNHNALTGPLIRNDTKTIIDNLVALKDDAFQQVYESFVNCYRQGK